VLSAIHAEDILYVARENVLMVRQADVGLRPFNQLSDGQIRIASIFCDLAMRCASLNSHLGAGSIAKTPGLVTIDELDLHLHPKWQQQVVGDLRRVFPLLQFIVTSHSPFLLQAAFEHGSVVDMATGQFVSPSDPSIEDIAENTMGVVLPQRGQRFQAMKAAAMAYYALLEQVPTATPEAKAAIKQQLDDALIPYTNDPAYAAFLEMHRAAAGV
jgi:predicted ATP-binding protein involved in virulence